MCMCFIADTDLTHRLQYRESISTLAIILRTSKLNIGSHQGDEQGRDGTLAQ